MLRKFFMEGRGESGGVECWIGSCPIKSSASIDLPFISLHLGYGIPRNMSFHEPHSIMSLVTDDCPLPT